MPVLFDLISQFRERPDHRPWPKINVDEATWRVLSDYLAVGRWSLLGLWGDEATVHAAVLDSETIAILSLDCTQGMFPSLAQHHLPALRLERTIRDLW